MNKTIRMLAVAGLMLAASTLFAAELTIDYQFNLAGKDYANNYLTVKGPADSITKDQYVAVDATTGASKFKGTAVINSYAADAAKNKTLPAGFVSFMKYAVSGDTFRTDDALAVTKAADGVIRVRYIHRGTAYEFWTDNTGKLDFSKAQFLMRKIGHTDNVLSTDFSASGKTANAEWAKIWDTKIADGAKVGNTTSVTGKVALDTAPATSPTPWKGVLQFTLTGTVLKVSGTLTN